MRKLTQSEATRVSGGFLGIETMLSCSLVGGALGAVGFGGYNYFTAPEIFKTDFATVGVKMGGMAGLAQGFVIGAGFAAAGAVGVIVALSLEAAVGYYNLRT